MPTFRKGDWIKNRKNNTRYQVLSIHRDGQLVVERENGGVLLLTRPEEYKVVSPPESDTRRSMPKASPGGSL
jgi:hypothetical protein